MRIRMSDKDVLENVYKTIGGSLKLADKAGTRDHLRDVWLWRLHDGYAVVAVVEHLIPFLQGDKLRQADAYLKFAKLKLDYWEAGIKIPMAPEHRLKLLQAAYDARSFALGSGGPSDWRGRWQAELKELTDAQTHSPTTG